MRFFILLTVFAVATCQSDFNVTSPIQDYFLLSHRQLNADINIDELKITFLDTRAADFIQNLKTQHQILLTDINRVEQSLLPVQALGPAHKSCVQREKTRLIPYETTKSKLTSCQLTAQSRINSLTTLAKNYLNYAKTAANTNLPRAIATCNTTYADDIIKKQECVVTNVNTYSKTVYTNLDSVEKYLDTNANTLNDLSREGITCTFTTERNALVNQVSVTDAIERCILEIGEEDKSLTVSGQKAKTASLLDVVTGGGK